MPNPKSTSFKVSDHGSRIPRSNTIVRKILHNYSSSPDDNIVSNMEDNNIPSNPLVPLHFITLQFGNDLHL